MKAKLLMVTALSIAASAGVSLHVPGSRKIKKATDADRDRLVLAGQKRQRKKERQLKLAGR
ncbi:MAG: hypothetical protein OEY66_07330 [Gammaproteobacteria bacterium]|nr:hypothetical protein [Gammaproteobacteria bacterium]